MSPAMAGCFLLLLWVRFQPLLVLLVLLPVLLLLLLGVSDWLFYSHKVSACGTM
jgi:hypothetical protein